MNPSPRFAFGRRNYQLMWLGLAVLAAGFICMTLGDKEQYGEDFLGITLGPILLVTGFIIEFFAIMVRDPAVVAANQPVGGLTPPPATPTPTTGGFVPPAPAPAPTRPSYRP